MPLRAATAQSQITPLNAGHNRIDMKQVEAGGSVESESRCRTSNRSLADDPIQETITFDDFAKGLTCA